MDVYEHCARTVRELDRDRYIADLFAPEPARRHLFALHAFSAEVARIRDTVTDPVLGEIRLQWWRDALLTGSGGHPVASALVETIRTFACRWPDRGLIDARMLTSAVTGCRPERTSRAMPARPRRR
jgi:phytoene synthase